MITERQVRDYIIARGEGLDLSNASEEFTECYFRAKLGLPLTADEIKQYSFILEPEKKPTREELESPEYMPPSMRSPVPEKRPPIIQAIWPSNRIYLLGPDGMAVNYLTTECSPDFESFGRIHRLAVKLEKPEAYIPGDMFKMAVVRNGNAPSVLELPLLEITDDNIWLVFEIDEFKMRRGF